VLEEDLIRVRLQAVRCEYYLGLTIDLILQAQQDMQAAAEVVSLGGYGNIQSSLDYNNAALDKLNQAQTNLDQAIAAFPELDLSSVANYLAAKRESAVLAIASDEALLADDYSTASAKNVEFAVMDAQAVSLAALIPANLSAYCLDCYNTLTADLQQRYSAVRDQATNEDYYLRDYLGTNP